MLPNLVRLMPHLRSISSDTFSLQRPTSKSLSSTCNQTKLRLLDSTNLVIGLPLKGSELPTMSQEILLLILLSWNSRPMISHLRLTGSKKELLMLLLIKVNVAHAGLLVLLLRWRDNITFSLVNYSNFLSSSVLTVILSHSAVLVVGKITACTTSKIMAA